MTGKPLMRGTQEMTHQSLTRIHDRLSLNNKIRTTSSWLLSKINGLGDGDGVISACFRNFQLFNVNSSKQVIFFNSSCSDHVRKYFDCLRWQDGHHAYTFCWFSNSLQTLLGQLVITLQKFIRNSYFVRKIKFQWLSSFLTNVFV